MWKSACQSNDWVNCLYSLNLLLWRLQNSTPVHYALFTEDFSYLPFHLDEGKIMVLLRTSKELNQLWCYLLLSIVYRFCPSTYLLAMHNSFLVRQLDLDSHDTRKFSTVIHLKHMKRFKSSVWLITFCIKLQQN